jgi:hypothetical protein
MPKAGYGIRNFKEKGGNGAIILTNVQKYSKTLKNCIEIFKN